MRISNEWLRLSDFLRYTFTKSFTSSYHELLSIMNCWAIETSQIVKTQDIESLTVTTFLQEDTFHKLVLHVHSFPTKTQTNLELSLAKTENQH